MAKRNSFSRKIRHWLENAGVEIITFAIRHLSAQQVFRLGKTIGALAYTLSSRRRRIGKINLDIAFGDRKTSSEKNVLLKKSYRQIGVSALQSVWLLPQHPRTGIRITRSRTQRPGRIAAMP